MRHLRLYFYWAGLRRQARAYLAANNLRAVASAMLELDRQAGTGDCREAIGALKDALSRTFCRQGLCVRVSRSPHRRDPGDAAGAGELGQEIAELTFLVEGRHYTWLAPVGALGFDLLDGRESGPQRTGRPPQGRSLWPECRDALMAVVYEYLRRNARPIERPPWLPTLRQALRKDLAA